MPFVPDWSAGNRGSEDQAKSKDEAKRKREKRRRPL